MNTPPVGSEPSSTFPSPSDAGLDDIFGPCFDYTLSPSEGFSSFDSTQNLDPLERHQVSAYGGLSWEETTPVLTAEVSHRMCNTWRPRARVEDKAISRSVLLSIEGKSDSLLPPAAAGLNRLPRTPPTTPFHYRSRSQTPRSSTHTEFGCIQSNDTSSQSLAASNPNLAMRPASLQRSVSQQYWGIHPRCTPGLKASGSAARRSTFVNTGTRDHCSWGSSARSHYSIDSIPTSQFQRPASPASSSPESNSHARATNSFMRQPAWSIEFPQQQCASPGQNVPFPNYSCSSSGPTGLYSNTMLYANPFGQIMQPNVTSNPMQFYSVPNSRACSISPPEATQTLDEDQTMYESDASDDSERPSRQREKVTQPPRSISRSKSPGRRARSRVVKNHKTSKSLSRVRSASAAGLGFVNFTANDSQEIMTAVAPSGSSKTKARRDKEANEKRKKMSEAATKLIRDAGVDIEELRRQGLLAEMIGAIRPGEH